MRIPSTAAADVQQSFREVWASVDRVAGPANVNLAGRRLTNAGQAVDPFDYVTKYDLDQAVELLETRIMEALNLDLEGLSTGSVLFMGGGGVIAQDNRNFFYDNPNDRLGLGIRTDLASRLHLRGTTVPGAEITIDAYTVAPDLRMRRINGTPEAPTATANGNTIFNLTAAGYANAAFTGDRWWLRVYAAEAWTSSAQGTSMEIWSTKPTTITPSQRFTLAYANSAAFGTVADPAIQVQLGGVFASTTSAATCLYIASEVTVAAANGNLIGVAIIPTLVEYSSGTHPLMAGLWVEPSFTNHASATCTLAVGAYLDDFAAPAGTVDACNLYIPGAPTGGTNNYPIWIANGTPRIDFNVQTTIGAAGAGAALPANPIGYFRINISGTNVAVPYYNRV